MATAFGTHEELSDDELAAAPVRYPRPSRLEEELEVAPAPAAEGAKALGLLTVGDLLEHLPRDRGEAKTIAELAPGETATVVVDVRSITSRPVRRRGMRPLVEATVADGTGPMKVTFFNQPWLANKYKPGTRLVLQGKFEGRNRFKVNFHAPTNEATAGHAGAVAQYPATKGLDSTRILALVGAHRDALTEVVEPLPAELRVPEGLPDRTSALTAMHFPERAADAERARRRLAFEELLLVQLALLRRRARRQAA
ncbi:MAG: ATP-dependent helicase RecG, partial [Solirubrobacterales bacterium]|nr:ATP-dependent helicase RecG [Solirubrobacterales bacterium]